MTYFEQTANGKEYRSDDGNATEDEVREFIKGLCAIMKPSVVLETGCYKGGLSVIIADAIPQDAHLFTCDTDSEMVAFTMKLFRFTHHGRKVEIWQSPGVDLIWYLSKNNEVVDLAILDSSGNRLEEAIALIEIMRTGGIILIHDTNRQAEYDAVFALKARGFNCIEFGTPRGLTMLQKSC